MKNLGKIVIPGGTGFLGTSLGGYLSGLGYEVVILSRSPKSMRNGTILTIIQLSLSRTST